jgi:tRNA A-37 threonylcarbamoyl transferase component Bud32
MEFECIKLKIRKWIVTVEGVPDPKGFAELCCRDSKEEKSEFDAVNCSRSTKVFRFEWAGNSYYYKEYLFQNIWKHRKVVTRGTHLRRVAHQMSAAGLRSPRIVCHARSGFRIFVVSEAVEDCCTVSQLFLNLTPTPLVDGNRFRKLFGQEIGRLHNAGFAHGDLRWGNVLVQHANTAHPVFIFIDNDRTKKYKRIPDRLRLMNIAQIKFTGSLKNHPESEWNAIWEGYLVTSPEARKNGSKWLGKVDRKLDRRIRLWWKKSRNRHLLEEKMANEGSS